MLQLAVQLTPPAKGSQAAKMSITQYLTSSETTSSLKRKASLPTITPAQAKHFRLDPQPDSNDITIADYHERASEIVGRSHVQVMIPFEQAWNKSLERIAKLEREVADLRKENAVLRQENADLRQENAVLRQENAVLRQENADLRQEIADLRQENSDLRQELADLRKKHEQEMQDQARPRLSLLAGNAIIDLAKFVYKNTPEAVKDPSTHRLQQLAANVTDKQLVESQVPPKYWPLIRKLPEFIKHRNMGAHESSVEFAQLLVSSAFRHSHHYEVWKGIFPLLYGGSVEEVAQGVDEFTKLLEECLVSS